LPATDQLGLVILLIFYVDAILYMMHEGLRVLAGRYEGCRDFTTGLGFLIGTTIVIGISVAVMLALTLVSDPFFQMSDGNRAVYLILLAGAVVTLIVFALTRPSFRLTIGTVTRMASKKIE